MGIRQRQINYKTRYKKKEMRRTRGMLKNCFLGGIFYCLVESESELKTSR